MKKSLKGTLADVAIMGATVMAALAFGTYVPALYQDWKGNTRSGEFSQHLEGLPASLTLYGTKTCPACIRARSYLKASRIPFNDRILEESAQAKRLYGMLGESSVPIMVTKEKLVIGFNEVEYAALAADLRK